MLSSTETLFSFLKLSIRSKRLHIGRKKERNFSLSLMDFTERFLSYSLMVDPKHVMWCSVVVHRRWSADSSFSSSIYSFIHRFSIVNVFYFQRQRLHSEKWKLFKRECIDSTTGISIQCLAYRFHVQTSNVNPSVLLMNCTNLLSIATIESVKKEKNWMESKGLRLMTSGFASVSQFIANANWIRWWKLFKHPSISW